MFKRLPIFVLLLSVFSAAAGIGGSAVNLNSGGSTFIYPIFAKWNTEYRKIHPEMHLWYDPVGSGRGISRTLAGTVDFGASDGPLTDAQVSRAPQQILHIPVVLGAVVPAYNLPGVRQAVRFTAEALAGVYLGRITRWNDPEIARANRELRLPPNDIQVVLRTDGSGTTYIWTDYLSKVSHEWNARIGRGTSVSFPVGVGAQFNEGVVDYVQSHPYSLGYLQVTYAVQAHVQRGKVENLSGAFVEADSASITAAAAATATDMPDDFRVSVTNARDSDAYPISSFTWLLVPAKINDRSKRESVAGLLRWILTDGQKFAAPLDYAPLPGDVALRVLRAVDRIQ